MTNRVLFPVAIIVAALVVVAATVRDAREVCSGASGVKSLAGLSARYVTR